MLPPLLLQTLVSEDTPSMARQGWMFQYSAGEENAERLRRRQMRHNTGPERSKN